MPSRLRSELFVWKGTHCWVGVDVNALGEENIEKKESFFSAVEVGLERDVLFLDISIPLAIA
jgi:hypothetical protein